MDDDMRMFAALDGGIRDRAPILLYGFSRGGQTAHRLALIYPADVKAAALMSAGTYTLPATSTGNASLPFPFGIADLERYTGKPFDAKAFAAYVDMAGAKVELATFPGLAHQESAASLDRAMAFLAR